MIKKAAKILIVIMILGVCTMCVASDTKEGSDFRILFTHDIHSYMDIKTGIIDDEEREFGGASRLSTLIKEYKDKNSIYVDAGDTAMGTLYQSCYATDAYELRMLGKIGCDITTFGNHEFDYGLKGVASNLNSALDSGDPLPLLIESSFSFSDSPTNEQKLFKSVLEKYGMTEYTIKEINGVKVGFFAVEGYDSIECIQADISFDDYIEVANKMVSELQDKTDVIVCLSHSGINADKISGEDVDLAKKVSGIDVIVSGHSHSTLTEALKVNDTYIVSAGSYLQYLGNLELNFNNGNLTLKNYELIRIDDKVEEDAEINATLSDYKTNIKNTYLKLYGGGGDFDDVLCTSSHDFMSLNEMYEVNKEFDIGNLIADSYIYKAKSVGVDDIDVALVGLGTIRGSILEGDVTLKDAFEICSLGVSEDGTAGHPLLSAYITGEELKLLVELDASLGDAVSSIKMSYSGLKYEYNSNRVILDRVTDVYLVDANGKRVEIVDDQLYKVCCNMYAANMLGMLNGLTKGILKIEPKYIDGSPIVDFYDVAILDESGKDVKEWVAFKDYLLSFDSGEIPEAYSKDLGRKVDTNLSGLKVLNNPGLTTIVVIVFIALITLILLMVSGKTVKKVKKKKKNKNKSSNI